MIGHSCHVQRTGVRDIKLRACRYLRSLSCIQNLDCVEVHRNLRICPLPAICIYFLRGLHHSLLFSPRLTSCVFYSLLILVRQLWFVNHVLGRPLLGIHKASGATQTPMDHHRISWRAFGIVLCIAYSSSS